MAKNKRFICFQSTIEHLAANAYGVDVKIRNVGAKNEAEAIGKFMLDVSNNKGSKYQKLDPVCIELSNLKKID